MKKYTEFDHTEIEAIADKYHKGEFVAPKGKESKLWYDYKRAVKNTIHDAKAYLKMVYDAHLEDEGFEPSLITKEAETTLNEAKKELEWVRSVPTFDLEAFCEYWVLATEEYTNTIPVRPRFTNLMAKRVISGDASESDKQFVREMFEESEYRDRILHFRQLITPVALRHWGKMWNNPSEYYPSETPCDATELYDHRTHYVYIQGTNVARWGESYWISVDCDNTLYSLPVIKAFKDFEFEVGKFYKITCTDELRWGNNKRKYIMDIEETDEETFLKEGLKQYATRW